MTPRILTGDCLALLPTLPPAGVHAVVTDPPFNQGLLYPGYHDRRPDGEFLAWLASVFRCCLPLLTPTGSVWVACSPRLQAEALVLLKGLGLHWRQTVIWHYTFGPCQQVKFTPSYTPIHHLTVHPKRHTFNASSVRVPSWRQLHGDKRADPRGKVPDDVWQFPRICGTFRRRVQGHPCQQPVELLERIVRVSTDPGQTVLDPFAGTGSTLVAAARLGRRAIGIELHEATADKANTRLLDEVGHRGDASLTAV